MREINLLESNPKPERRIEKGWRINKNKIIAKKFGFDFFDGDRINGYGGYYYDGRWKAVVNKLIELYGINSESSVLDIGCGKGFLLYDLQNMIPGIKVAGIDISEYAINKAMDKYGEFVVSKGHAGDPKEIEEEARKKVLPFMIEGSADKLPYPNNSFDLVLNINTAHNLPLEQCRIAVQEMIRVSNNKKNMFIQLDSYRNETEKERMDAWAITAETTMFTHEWLKFLKDSGYDGDYYWTIV